MAREIDIQTVIEEIQSSLDIPSYSEHDKGFDDGLKYVLDLIEKAPTLTPPNEWVSVEERLPPLRENVLVCAYWHEHWGVYMGWNSGHGWTVSCGIGQRSDVQVSHWMLLPAPPAKEDQK